MKLVKIYVDEIPECCGDCIYNGGYFDNWYLVNKCALVFEKDPFDEDYPQAKLSIGEMYKKRLPECPLELAENMTKIEEPKCYICGEIAIGGCVDMIRTLNEQSGCYDIHQFKIQ